MQFRIDVGCTRTGIEMDAVVRLCGEIVKATAEATKDNDSLGCAKLVVFCNMHRMTTRLWPVSIPQALPKADAVMNVGVSGPGVVKKGARDRCAARALRSCARRSRRRRSRLPAWDSW